MSYLRVHDLAVGDVGRRAGQVERVVLPAPACRGDRTQTGDPGTRMLADAARSQPVVAEERERVLQALRERRDGRIGRAVLMHEVDPESGGLRALAVEREERVVHRVEVLVRQPAAARCERRLGMEGARVTVRGDAQAREVLQCALGGALPRLRGEELVPELGQCAGRPGGAPADRAVCGDDDAPGFEPRLRGAVRPRAALRRLDVDRAVDRVELGQGRQALLGKLHGRDRTDRGDELARRDLGAPRLHLRDHVGDREDVLERDVPAGPVADEDDVVVRVDDPRDHRAPLQVQHLVGRMPVDAVADLEEAAILDQDLLHHSAGAVHRVDLALRQDEAFELAVRVVRVRPRRGRRLAATQRRPCCSEADRRTGGGASENELLPRDALLVDRGIGRPSGVGGVVLRVHG